MSSDMAPPGSSTYSSNTLHVGDGTWDTQRNTFLLPNLMGLNFETMRYNGMGNRFRDMPGYHSLIRAHGVIATITFLGLVPAAILLARFYSRRPYWALRLHIWLQVLTLFLSTVVFVLGWFAVGPARSLTNPHHGIGLAIYVMVIFQTLWGYFVHKREKGKRRLHIPLKLMIHQWLGRTLALLGIIQIPLGLTLYGSPAVLFILFSVAAFALLVIYFVLSYLHERRVGVDYDSRGSYLSGPEVIDESQSHHHHAGRYAAAGAAGVGLAALGNKFRRRSESKSRVDEPESQGPHGSYISEKYSDDSHHAGWGKRLLQIGAIGGGAMFLKKLFDRRRDRESDSESGQYRPAHGRSDSITEDSLSRVEEGRPPPSHGPQYSVSDVHNRPQSQTSMSYDSYFTGDDDRGHGIRNTIAGLGAFAAIRGLFKSRKEKDEQRRIEELRRRDIEEERIARANSQRKYTGDGQPPRRKRPELQHPDDSVLSGEPMATGALHPQPADIPPVPPAHRTASGSEIYMDRHDNRPHRRRSGADPAAELAGEPTEPTPSHQLGSNEGQGDSPRVSVVKVKVHPGGRRVTLRQLTGEEASANREARHRDRERRSSRRRHGSVSSFSGNNASADRWRRVEEIERRQAEQMQQEAPQPVQPPVQPENQSQATVTAPAPSHSGIGTVPQQSGLSVPGTLPGTLPPGAGSITSPGGTTMTGTETSTGDFASNRRRRRAERAQARQARQTHNVEFT
ncbi:hypothetical protein FQN54_008242 [Arachnomyces sp. PD_36]|nr:hypothetical protein FQN54_008242 [Arachnomyces sp. PD_36]